MSKITESHIESYAIEILQSLGFQYVYGPDIAPEAEQAERSSYEDVLLLGRLRSAIARINPTVPEEARERALKEVERIASPDVLANNEAFHRYLTDGVTVEYRVDGEERSDQVWLIDFTHPLENDFLVTNQFTIEHNNQVKRPDILLFVNGIPLVVFELKNAADEKTTVDKAYQQIQTYKALIPGLFTYNGLCVISDGHECKAGSVSAKIDRYMSWKSVTGEKEASRFTPEIETLIKGMLSPETLLDLVRNFVVFQKLKKEDVKSGITQIVPVKILAAYHQYFAVNKAITTVLKAASAGGDHKGGVVWHTQGSGKSLSMVFYTGKLVQRLNNPTIVVLTDRNDLDDQLFDTFAISKQLLRQEPVQAESRDHLKKLLRVASGGIVFTTIHKFLPEDGKAEFELLSDRTNIVVIADEAHRTQYGFDAKLKDVRDKETKQVIGKRIAYGLAKYLRDALPNATYIGFTGTPIEAEDVNTPAVFGKYVDIYDIKQAVDDKATVTIYYENRLAKVNLTEEGRILITQLDKELETDDDLSQHDKAKIKWTKLEAIVGSEERLKNVAKDMLAHFDKRQSVFEGKGMIVCMSRRIAARLYDEIVALRPEWHNTDNSQGVIKVVMTSSSDDGPELSKFNTSKNDRRLLADRMKDPQDPMKLVIVCDMWLTGFDAPCLHTMYIDKPMHGHTLMQAIARVNRVFGDKPGGLVVDYLGIAPDLKKALSFYTDAGGKGDPTQTLAQAVGAMMEKFETVRHIFTEASHSKQDILLEEAEAYHNGSGFNYNRFFPADAREKLSIILQAEEHILGVEKGKERYIAEVTMLGQAFALASSTDEAAAIRDEVAFFEAVKARLAKFTNSGSGSSGSIESTIKRIVSESLASDSVVDIFEAAGIAKPNLTILSDEFLLEVKGMKHKNLALELLKRILNNEIRSRVRTNLVKSRLLLEMLEDSIKRYQNNLLSTAEVIDELINIAKDVRESDKEAEKLGLSQDEVAFYNALGVNDSAVQVLGDDTLRTIAREIAEKVRNNTTIDWTIRESSRAKLMVLVKRTLTKYGYPPDKQKEAIDLVLKQAAYMADYWVEEDH